MSTGPDEHHRLGLYCGEPAHCTEPYPGAQPGARYPVAALGGPDLTAATTACQALFAALGIVGDDHTPARHVRALAELTRGIYEAPEHHLETTFPPVSADPGLIVVADVPFVSLCAHHGLPFTGTFTLAYLPKQDARIVGLSKLARMVTGFAARPQVQERIAAQAIAALINATDARGAAIALRATHSCMALRGARTGPAAAMVTVEHTGDLRADPWRTEFATAAYTVIRGR